MDIYTSIAVEFLLVSSTILLLFKFRTKLGLAPLYILLGAVQYVQAISGTLISYKIFGEITIYPGSVILFSALLFAVLLIYIKEGVASARVLIIGIIISNFFLSALFGLTYVQEFAGQNIKNIDSSSVFLINYKFFITGTIILLLDFILLVTIYQFLISKVKRLNFFIILFISLFSVLIFDALLFNISLKYGTPDFKVSLIGHIIGKSISALTFSLILYGYLKFIDDDKTSSSFIADQNRDIFSILKYRKRYFDLKVEKKQVEQKLTSQLETTLDNISDGFVSLDTNWCYTYVNIKAAEFLGRSQAYLIGKHIWTEFPEGVDLPLYNAYYKAVDKQKTVYLEEFYEPLNKWLENRIYPSPDGLAIYFTDVTEQKKAELALKESENHIRTILETEPECIKQLSSDGKLLYMNPAGLAMIEADNLEMIQGQSILDIIMPDHQIAFNKLSNQIFKGKSGQLEFEIKGLKGTKRWLDTHAVPLKNDKGDIISLLGVTRDISDRKKVEEKLVKSEQLFRRLTSNAPVAIFQTDIEGSCNYVNEEWMKYSGMSFEAAMGFGWTNAIHPDDKERVRNEVEQAIAAGTQSVIEYRFQNLKKQTTWLSTKTVELYDAQNKLYGYIGIAIDITERKKAEVNLKQTLSQLNLAVDTAKLGVWTHNIETGRLIWNSELFEMFGIAPSEFDYSVHTPMKFVHPEDLEYVMEQQEQVLQNKPVSGFDFRIIRPNDEVRNIFATVTPIIDEEGNLTKIIGINLDVTEIKSSELELKRAFKEITELKLQLEAENVYLKEELKLEGSFNEIVGTSKSLAKILKQVEQVAKTDATVLILGETGTGKELIAKAVHRASNRKDKPLIKVNCSALPSELIESELFGHEKGAFTGAINRKIGRFELANGGTIFLDEIGDLPIGLQTRLLRVLQESEFERVGGETTIKVDVRVITATNRNLAERVAENKFREDLYYRLNVFPITCSPLRDRKEDIPSLVNHFVNKHNHKVSNKIEKVHKTAIERLMKYKWPGNIRELEHVIERAIIVNHGEQLRLGNWFIDTNPQNVLPDELTTLEVMERNHIEKVLEKTNWKIRGENGASEILGIKPTTLESRMKKLNIHRRK